MIVRHFRISGLHQNRNLDFDLDFNEDINILTGSGKTTVLKLIWYLTSENL